MKKVQKLPAKSTNSKTKSWHEKQAPGRDNSLPKKDQEQRKKVRE